MSFFNDADQRGKAYAYTLLGCILAIAIIGLLGIWGLRPEDSMLYKLIEHSRTTRVRIRNTPNVLFISLVALPLHWRCWY